MLLGWSPRRPVLRFQLQGAGRSCPGFWAPVPVPSAAVWVAVVENWLNWSPCLLLLAGSGLTTVLCPGMARAGLGKTHGGSGSDLG